MPPFEVALLDPLQAPKNSFLSACSDHRDFQEPSRDDASRRRDSEDSSSSSAVASGPDPYTNELTHRSSASRPSGDQIVPECSPATVPTDKRKSSLETEQTPEAQSSNRRRSRYYPRQNPQEKEIKLLQELYFELLKKQNSASGQPTPSRQRALEKLEKGPPEMLQERPEIYYAAGVELLLEFYRRWMHERTPQGSGQCEQQESETFGELNQAPEHSDHPVRQNSQDDEKQHSDVQREKSQEQAGVTSPETGVSRPDEGQQQQNDLHQETKEEYPMDLSSNQQRMETVEPSSNFECSLQETLQQQQQQPQKQIINQNDPERKATQTPSKPVGPQPSNHEQKAEQFDKEEERPTESQPTHQEESENNTQVPPKKARKSKKSQQEVPNEKAFAELLLRSQLLRQTIEQQKQAASSELQQQLTGRFSPLAQQSAAPLQNLMNLKMNSGLLQLPGQMQQRPPPPSPRYPQMEMLLRAPQQPSHLQQPPPQITQEELLKRLPQQTSLQRVESKTSLSQNPAFHRQPKRKSLNTPQQPPLLTQTQQSPQLSQVSDRSRLLQLLQQSPHLQLTQIQATPRQMPNHVTATMLTTLPQNGTTLGPGPFAAPLDQTGQQPERKKRRSSKIQLPQQQLIPRYPVKPQKQSDTAQGMQTQAGEGQKNLLSETLRRLLTATQVPGNVA